jgi:O-antigen/teichoic acid export membrane protein
MLALTGRHVLGAAAIPLILYATAFQLGTAEAGIFQIAVRLYSLVDSIVMTPYRFVVMPIFAMARKGKIELAKQVSKAVRLGSLIASPAYFCLIVIAPSLIPFVLGEKNGSACVLAVQLLSINGVMAAPTNVINQILVARGYASAVFRRSLLMYVLAIFPALLATLHSVQAVAFVYGTVGGLSGLIVTLVFAKKYLYINVGTVVRGWLRLSIAGALLLLLYGIYQFISPGNYLFQMALILTLSPVLFLLVLLLIARGELRALIDVVRGH